MHIPDGMLSTPTWAASWLASIPVVGYAVRRLRVMTDSRVVLMAVMAALVFALQMLNFPIAGGTSGHFAGGAAAAILLGPWPAVAVLTTVLVIQAVLFADGGITSLGANILNMAVVAPIIGWWVFRGLGRIRAGAAWRSASAFTAAWCATVASALGAAIMLWFSGRVPLGISVGAMSFWHALIGIGEGVITAGLVSYLAAVRPDVLDRSERDSGGRGAALVLAGIAAAAVGLSFAASSHPDGLEYVYERYGKPFAESDVIRSPLPDYLVPGVSNEVLAGILAGIVGLFVTGALLYVFVRAVRGRPVD